MGLIGEILAAVVKEISNDTAYTKGKDEWRREMEDRSLSCNVCGALAEPLPRSINRYKCGSCGRQFAGARHGMVTWEDRKQRIRLEREGRIW
jgi:hypothetical protein